MKILHPGQRTPFFKAVTLGRNSITEKEERLIPLVCYYLSKKKPSNYIRIEVPIYFYNQDPDLVEKAIEIVAWQHELGNKAPFVQLTADRMCQVDSEKRLIEKNIKGHLFKNNIDKTEKY
jgi:hypothetical protein